MSSGVSKKELAELWEIPVHHWQSSSADVVDWAERSLKLFRFRYIKINSFNSYFWKWKSMALLLVSLCQQRIKPSLQAIRQYPGLSSFTRSISGFLWSNQWVISSLDSLFLKFKISKFLWAKVPTLTLGQEFDELSEVFLAKLPPMSPNPSCLTFIRITSSIFSIYKLTGGVGRSKVPLIAKG